MSPVVARAIAVAQLLAGLCLAGFALHTVLPDSGRVSYAFDYYVYYGLVICAVALALGRAATRPHRLGWAALATAVCAFAAGEFLWLFAYSGAASPPFPSWADALYLSFYPASYVGVVVLFRARVRGVGAGLWIDGVTAALAAGALGSAVLVDVVLDSTEGSAATVTTNLAYPLGDVLLLSLVIGAFALTRWRPGRAWLLIGAALVVFAIGDSIYLFQTAREEYVEGSLLDVSWPAALLLIACAGWQDRGASRRIEGAGRAFLLVPAACAAIALAVLALDHFHRVNLLAVVLATLTLGGVVARLGLTFRENTRLLEVTRRDAVTDHVTGLGNRRLFVERLERVAEDAHAGGRWLLVLFDLDGFKGYNDAFGHPAGDRLLARLGGKLERVGDGGVTAYRLGGDEFCLLSPASDVDLERLLDEASTALAERGEGFEVTSSFDDEEWEFVRRHTLVGERILAVSPLLRPIGRIVRSTHERWDGTGYPDGLAGEEIPFPARVICVADAYDAMRRERPYRPPLDERAALDELERCDGSQFDPLVVMALRASLGARVLG